MLAIGGADHAVHETQIVCRGVEGRENSKCLLSQTSIPPPQKPPLAPGSQTHTGASALLPFFTSQRRAPLGFGLPVT